MGFDDRERNRDHIRNLTLLLLVFKTLQIMECSVLCRVVILLQFGKYFVVARDYEMVQTLFSSV
ncbi:hypothetical protein Plhal304r1_c030g0097221 [Plasmopara halstedii]